MALAETGRDEVAAVARSVNRMLAHLRGDRNFFERINADLRARSEALARALETLRETEVELVRSERMASIAVLVKGIAHELNNPITYIAGNIAPLRRYAQFLTRVALELADGRARSPEEIRAITQLSPSKDLAFVVEDLERLTTDVGEGARRAALIIGDLQNLTAVSHRGIELVDLARVVRQTVALLAPRTRDGVTIETSLSDVSPLHARAGELEQVLLNLVDNAVRAVGARGTVRIGLRTIEGHAELSVLDDGPGMTDDVKRQAFEPFFTTRPAGDGSGLGLAIVASIVRAHQGVVSVKSELGLGTEFTVRLPLPLTESDGIRPSLAGGCGRGSAGTGCSVHDLRGKNSHDVAAVACTATRHAPCSVELDDFNSTGLAWRGDPSRLGPCLRRPIRRRDGRSRRHNGAGRHGWGLERGGGLERHGGGLERLVSGPSARCR